MALALLGALQTLELGAKWKDMARLEKLAYPERVQYSWQGKDKPQELPVHIPKAAMNIEWPDDELYGIYQDDEWASVFPKSNGWVALGPERELFVVSMFHQMHCLDALRYGYAAAKHGYLQYPGNGTGVEHHVNHCLVYLREIILCGADTTLEYGELAKDDTGKVMHGASGLDVMHQCKDWTAIRAALDENFKGRLARGEVTPEGQEILQGY
ncbi:hypothetical protein PENSPDRAFT_693021 [Peniophora sp. CONT]|nr:hypothetical protein PENSPDRAFT_693021 [Peniophora sp. CONT]